MMARRLAAAGIEHELITISDGPHGFDHSPDTDSNTAVSDAFESVMTFLSKHV